MPKGTKRGDAKRQKAKDRKKLMADVAAADAAKPPPKRKRRSAAEMDEVRKGIVIEAAGAAPTRATRRSSRVRKYGYEVKSQPPRTSKAFFPVMGKPKPREEQPLILRWLESHADRFESESEARKHFQEKVCEHPAGKQKLLSTQNKRGGLRMRIYSCQVCHLVTKTRVQSYA